MMVPFTEQAPAEEVKTAYVGMMLLGVPGETCPREKGCGRAVVMPIMQTGGQQMKPDGHVSSTGETHT